MNGVEQEKWRNEIYKSWQSRTEVSRICLGCMSYGLKEEESGVWMRNKAGLSLNER